MAGKDLQKYTVTARVLHWAIALLIIMMLVFGQGFDGTKTPDELAYSLMGHSSLGLMVISLVILRFIWRAGHKPPPLPSNVGAGQARVATIAHWTLYGLMVIVPLTGFLTASAHETPVVSFGAFDLRGAVGFVSGEFDLLRLIHTVATKLLILVLAIHIVAALVHQFAQRDGVLRRIIF